MEKLEIKDLLYTYYDNYIFDGEIEEVCLRIKSLPNRLIEKLVELKNNPNKYDKFILQSYDDEGLQTNIYGIRLETNEEYKERQDLIERRKLANIQAQFTKIRKKEKQEKELYQRLKKKYEDI